MDKKARVLYLMHVDWNWIKQRPHFLAETLSAYFDIDVYYGKSFHRSKNLSRNQAPEGLAIKPLIRLPMFLCKFPVLKKAAGLVNRILIGYKIKKYDIVWFCHPVFFDDVAPALREGQTVVYDCMDDVLEFPSVKKDRALSKYLSGLEKRLTERSQHVFCSAVNLKRKLSKRFGFPGKYRLVNNGMNLAPGSYSVKPELPAGILEAMNVPGKTMTYIGTISEWMDFELVLAGLEENPGLTCFLFGPLAPGVEVPSHPRLVYLGPVAHRLIMQVMKKSDLLVMPFRLNELILSVDPVKLYEYVYSGVPTLALGYPETEKFGDFVYLYRNRKEFLAVLKRLAEGKLKAKKNSAACRKFSSLNTWEHRASDIAAVMSREPGRSKKP